MPLYFRPRSKRPMGKPAQYAIAFAVLAAMLLLLLAWLSMRYMGSRPQKKPDNDSSPSLTTTYTAADDGALLLLLTDEGSERFLLIQASPADKSITVARLSSTTPLKDGQTPLQILQKSGPAKVTKAVASATGIPVDRYMALTTAKAEGFLADLGGGGLSFSLPEAVQFTDSQGTTMRLEAGMQVLSAGQIAGLLRYNGWTDPSLKGWVSGELVAALINRYLLPTRSLQGDFAALSNIAKTNMRIDDYTAYGDRLFYLAQANAATPICRQIALSY